MQGEGLPRRARKASRSKVKETWAPCNFPLCTICPEKMLVKVGFSSSRFVPGQIRGKDRCPVEHQLGQCPPKRHFTLSPSSEFNPISGPQLACIHESVTHPPCCNWYTISAFHSPPYGDRLGDDIAQPSNAVNHAVHTGIAYIG